MNTEDKIRKIYEVDLQKLSNDLKSLSVDERMSLFEVHQQRVFPDKEKPINMRELYNDRLEVNRERFRHCFMIICGDLFSTSLWGQYDVRRFKEKTGIRSDHFFHKVIMSLSLMGYIKGIKCNYSSGNHGIIYNIDYLKWEGLDKDLWSSEPTPTPDTLDNLEWVEPEPSYDQPDRIYSDIEKEWLIEKQLKTIKSISVDKSEYWCMMKKKDQYLQDPTLKTWKEKELNHIDSIERLYHKSRGCFNVSIKSDKTRCYTVMCNLKSDKRTNGTLLINGEKLCEVDLSSLHPTLFGLHVKERHGDLKSEWLDHCLKGDFYEWVIEITGLNKEPVEKLIRYLNKSIGGMVYSKNEGNKGLKNKIESYNKVIVEIENGLKSEKDICELYRPVVKNWIMNILFSRFKVSSSENLYPIHSGKENSIYKHFCHNLFTYLKENEPRLYETLDWYRTEENLVLKSNGKKKSQLPMVMEQEEVRFIKRCLKNLDGKVKYLYTIHDCIGTVESECDKVKKIMERTSKEMYGHKLKLKIKSEDLYEPPLW